MQNKEEAKGRKLTPTLGKTVGGNPPPSLMMKLVEVAAKVAYIQKSEKGEQGHYKYAPASVVNATILPELYERGVMLMPEIVSSDGEYVQEPSASNPNRLVYLAHFVMRYTFTDAKSGESISVPWDARAKHTDPAKAGGSALTYYSRYFLMNFFGVATDELDPDRFQKEVNPPDYITPEDWSVFRDVVYALADSDGCTISEQKLFTGAKQYNLDAFRVDKPAKLLKEQLKRVIQMIKDDPKMMITRYTALAEKIENDNKTEGVPNE